MMDDERKLKKVIKKKPSSKEVDKATPMPKVKKELGPSKPLKKLENYAIGEVVGKGGMGVVYKGIHNITGRVVAVKRVEVMGVDADQLANIQMEVDLMKKLNHVNIVQYIETIRDESYLHIILEFMENGSLSDIMKKFEIFPESLAATYMAQVLSGLDYLHKQGVIHRDIKGANILTTKDGLVKLADFGVACWGDNTSNSVVGTPYWMAPEIIEMSAPTPACDIWSVGCTVVEILGGKPPYFDLAPMAALFRIVQDDHPPLPSGISESATDFLLQCFKKEPSFRKSAEELLKHHWIKSTEKREIKSPARVGNLSLTSSIKVAGKAPVLQLNKPIIPDKDENDDDWGVDFEATAFKRGGKGQKAQPMPLKLPAGPNRRPSANEVEIGKQLRALEGAGNVIGGGEINLVSQLAGSLDAGEVDDMFWDDEPESKPAFNSKSIKGSVKVPVMIKKNDLSKFVDKDDDLWDGGDFAELKIGGVNSVNNNKVDLVAKLKQNLNNGLQSEDRAFSINVDDIADPFDVDFEVVDFEEDPTRDNIARQASEIMKLIRLLKPQERDSVILSSCKKLIQIFRENPEQRQHLITHHGVIPIMEMLEVSSPEVVQAVLQVVNEIIKNDVKFQENLSLIGLIPVMMRFAASNQTYPIRVEAAAFVRQVCSTSKMTLQMFIACGGLPVLVGLLDPPYDTNKELLLTAVEGIYRVFSLNTVQNDFCRLFAKFNLLPRLIHVLQYTSSDVAADASNVQRIANIFLIFATNGDQVVKEAMSDLTVLRGIMRLLKNKPTTSQDDHQLLIITLLKCVRNLCMASSCLESLAAAGTISTLIPFLGDSESTQEMKNTILHAMFYLCLVNRERQEQAVLVGIIPYLQDVIRNKSPLKQFALPIYCDLAHSSNITRNELSKHGGMEFYLELLSENYWNTHVVKCIAGWLVHNMAHVEGVLLKPNNIIKLINVFQSSREKKFENILEPFLDMITKSINLNRMLGNSSLFVMEIVERLKYPLALVRKNLLLIIKNLLEKFDNKKFFILMYNLYPVVQQLAAEDNPMVIVKEIGSKLLKDMDAVLLKM